MKPSQIVFTAFLASLSSLNTADAEDQIVNGKRFTVPDGCVIELVAGPPMIDRPINCDFDDRGRLYVTESSGTNENVNEQLKKKPHRIVRLEDSNGDGKFDKRTVFADNMMFPEGAMWFDGSLYVCAPPEIWKLTDTNGDGIADKREVWFDGKTLTGCANDLHGPFLGPDGWIYWCKGAFAEQQYETDQKSVWKTRASHIFRQRPEGGIVEPVMTGGMDNPVELVFMPDGERIFNATFLHHPHDGKRDGLAHAIYGGVYGKSHGVLDGHPRTGGLMPVLADHDASAPSGLIRLESSHFGKQFQNNVLCSSFNMHKIFRHRMTYKGSLLETKNEDFVVCHDLDFHPTDVIEDADGSVLIVDTGGWYKLCCPTSQLHKPDVLGGIYRVRKKDAFASGKGQGIENRKQDFWGTQIDWGSVNPVSFLTDKRFAVRKRARREAAKQKLVDQLQAILKDDSSSELIRLQAVWALCQCESEAARSANRLALVDSSPKVRQAAAHAASVWKDAEAVQQLDRLLRLNPATNRRVAAEALGRIRDPRAVVALLESASELQLQNNRIVDRGLEHSFIYALIQIGDARAIRNGLDAFGKSCPVTVRHIATMALAELNDSTLKKTVIDFARSEHPFLQRTGWSILVRHPEWGESLVSYFRSQFEQQKNVEPTRLKPFVRHPAILNEIFKVLQNDNAENSQLATQLLTVLIETKPKLNDDWKTLPTRLLATKDPRLRSTAIQWIKSMPDLISTLVVEDLLKIARNESLESDLRLLAYSTCQKIKFNDNDIAFLKKYLTVDHSVSLRALAVESLQRSRPNESQLVSIAKSIDRVGTGELPAILKLIRNGKDESLESAVSESLQQSKFVLAMEPAKLKELLGDISGDLSAKPAFQSLLRKIEQSKAKEIERMDKILTLVPNADIRRGQKLFHSNQASCIACHQMGYLGGRIGPSLSRIGRIRSERDLLESLMFPSLSFVRSYEPVLVETVDGKMYNGIIKNESEAVLELTIDAQKTVRIEKSEIENRKVGTKSIMPTGLDKEFSDQQLADLIRFLKESG